MISISNFSGRETMASSNGTIFSASLYVGIIINPLFTDPGKVTKIGNRIHNHGFLIYFENGTKSDLPGMSVRLYSHRIGRGSRTF
jgi:hypothetical protein